MEKNKIDLRVMRTKKSVKRAFISLVAKKGYEGITVQNIADEAMINRNTFYLHYKDKYDLMEKLCADSLENLNICLRIGNVNEYTFTQEMLTSVLENIFVKIENDIDLFKVLLDLNYKPNFTTHLKEELKKYILNAFGDQYQEKDVMVGLEYIVSGLVGIISLWIRESDHIKYSDIVEQLYSIHYNNIKEVFFKENVSRGLAE